MSPFDYLSVLISIVLGLSITQLLGGFAAMVRARDRISFYWPLPVQMTGLFLINVQVWWALFGLREKQHWTFGAFFVILLQPVTLYLMSAFITLDPVADGARFDQREFYFREKNWFFAAALATLLASLTKDLFVTGGPIGLPDLTAHGVFVAMSLTGLLTKNDVVQKILAPVTLILYCTYIAALFMALPR
jgi:hypothetical protein